MCKIRSETYESNTLSTTTTAKNKNNSNLKSFW